MLRKAFAAIAALSLVAQPALAQPERPDPNRERGYNFITRDTLLPIGILVGLIAIVVGLTLHKNKKRASP